MTRTIFTIADVQPTADFEAGGRTGAPAERECATTSRLGITPSSAPGGTRSAALLLPCERSVPQHLRQPQPLRLPPIEDRLDDVWCEASERQEPADIGVRDPLLLRKVGDRLRLTALDLPTPPVRSNQRLDQRVVSTRLRRRRRHSAGHHDQLPAAPALQPDRIRPSGSRPRGSRIRSSVCGLQPACVAGLRSLFTHQLCDELRVPAACSVEETPWSAACVPRSAPRPAWSTGLFGEAAQSVEQ